jgi:hypothetical protein
MDMDKVSHECSEIVSVETKIVSDVVGKISKLSFDEAVNIMIETVEQISGVTEFHLKSKYRGGQIISWLHMIFFLLNKVEGFSQNQIVHAFNRKEHSTVVYASNKQINLIKYKDYRKKFSKFIYQLDKNLTHYFGTNRVLTLEEVVVLFEKFNILEPMHPLILEYLKASSQKIIFRNHELEVMLGNYCKKTRSIVA